MKEDVLEQLVDDYLQHCGFFTQHNLKFRPRPDHPAFVRNQDSNHTDIDVIGIHPLKKGHDRVWVVSCKSWQAGFDVDAKISEISENKIRSGRESWRSFQELVQPKWTEALVNAVHQSTGQREFTYVTAVTHIRGESTKWQCHQPFCDALQGNPIKLLALPEMFNALAQALGTSVVPSQLGRTIQLLKASGATFNWDA